MPTDDAGMAESAAPPSKRGRRVLVLPWLDERIGVYEAFVKGMILARPTYSVAYVVIRNRDGSHRVTHRGTGIYDYFFEQDYAEDRWALDGHLDLLARRFKLTGVQLQRDVAYFDDQDSFARTLAALPEE